MRKRHQDIHIVDGEEARMAADHALVPVVVDLIGQGDDIALFEAQLTLVLWLEIVERPAAGLVHGDCGGGRKISHVCLYAEDTESSIVPFGVQNITEAESYAKLRVWYPFLYNLDVYLQKNNCVP